MRYLRLLAIPVIVLIVLFESCGGSVSAHTGDDRAPERRTVRTVSSDPSQRCPKFEAMFAQYGLVPVDTFSYLAYAESRCRIKAVNGIWDKQGNLIWALNADRSVDRGLFQINSSWLTVTRRVCGGGLDRLLVLDCNLRVAKWLLDHGGTAHWGLD